MVGSMVEGCAEMGLGRIDRLTDGVCSSKNYEAISKRLVRFIASGISAICEPDDGA